jgi:hypothetical protein
MSSSPKFSQLPNERLLAWLRGELNISSILSAGCGGRLRDLVLAAEATPP